LSPRDPALGSWHAFLTGGELGLGHFDAAISEGNKSLDAGNHTFWVYMNLAAAHALKGDIDDAKTALAEARRLNPKLNVKWVAARYANIPAIAEGLRKAGLPEE
jgi:adenylate cyclase